jgi:hypothetical protein
MNETITGAMRRKAEDMVKKLPLDSAVRQRLLEAAASPEGWAIDTNEWKALIRAAWIEIEKVKELKKRNAANEERARMSELMRQAAARLATRLPSGSSTRQRLLEVAASSGPIADNEDWRRLVRDGWLEMEAAGGLDWVPDVGPDDPGPRTADRV